jgi:hypothetical protein
MRPALSIIAFVLLSIYALGQEFIAVPTSAPLLRNEQGSVIQINITSTSGKFYPSKQRVKFDLGGKTCASDCIQIQTSSGVTKVFAQTLDPQCPRCSFSGTLSAITQTYSNAGLATEWTGNGTAFGTFTYSDGTQSQNVMAKLRFDTDLTNYSESLLPYELSSAHLDIVLALN